MASKQNKYPVLHSFVGLKHTRESHVGHERYSVHFPKNQRIDEVSESVYTWLSQCDGESTLADILQRYDAATHPFIWDAIEQSKTIQKAVYWSDEPVASGILPYQIIGPVEQKIGLKEILLHVTNACNFRCAHCYHNDYLSPNDLTLEEIDDLFQQFAENGVGHILLSGGEPFLRKDIMDIVHLAEKYYFTIAINTNGFFVTDEHLDYFAERSRVGPFSISIDGPTEAIHTHIRKNLQSWHKLLDLFQRMTDKGVPIRISSSISRQWMTDLSLIDDFIDLMDKYNVFFWVINFTSLTGEALREEYRENDQMTYPEAMRISRYILKALQEKQPQNIRNVNINEIFQWRRGQTDTVLPPGRKYATYSDQEVLCDMHKNLLMIEPDGTVPFCSLYKSRFPMEIGNLRTESVAEVWDKLSQLRIDHSVPKRQFCGSCDLLAYCGGGCPGHNPNPNADLLTTCDTASKALLPQIISEYDMMLTAK